ncbi:MAG TPA: polymer-forming cytoskeletal protein [Saprospiraceae bacterium]|nr:polymer-forming cytoskeletal protein [Saprospiraceae bacterium]
MSNGNNGVAPNSNNAIVAGTKIEGTITASSDIRIDGELVGDLDCKGRLVVGPEGRIKGSVTCQNAVIEGLFEGKLQVIELLNVRETARIEGEIITDKLMVQSGAIYNVTCSMGKISKGTNKPKEAVVTL